MGFQKIVESILDVNAKDKGIIIVSYPNSQVKNKQDDYDMAYHYDRWSSWNIMLSFGNKSLFRRPNKKNISIDSGDLILFNGDRVKHGVTIESGAGVENCRRITFQIRKQKLHRLRSFSSVRPGLKQS